MILFLLKSEHKGKIILTRDLEKYFAPTIELLLNVDPLEMPVDFVDPPRPPPRPPPLPPPLPPPPPPLPPPPPRVSMTLI